MLAQLEKLSGPAKMVGVEVRERNHVVGIALRHLQIGAKLLFKIDALVGGIIGTPRVGVVEQDGPTAGQVDTATVGVTEREDGDRMHGHL